MASRPLVQVYGPGNKVVAVVPTPQVFLSPIRHDLVRRVQSELRKNKRQAYAVKYDAGMQSSAESWGTGRAVARIPRVPGGGTHRAGQGAFGNMCRGGRMFAPTRIWRRWHRKVNLNQKRYAVASALAASAVPALVMARGHNIQNIAEVPLVLDNQVIDSITRTKRAAKLFETIKAMDDVERVQRTDRKRGGRSKWRNRPKTRRVGPLIVQTGHKVGTNQRGFRNLAGVEVVSVHDLNILKLAPGGHLGRFIIWTRKAFEQLDLIFGTDRKSSSLKSNYWLPRPIVTNPDLARIFNSDAVAQIVRARKTRPQNHAGIKPNYLVNKAAYSKLNPYYLVQRRLQVRKAFARQQAVEKRRTAFKSKVTALRKATKGSKEGKAALKQFKADRIKKIQASRAASKNPFTKYDRVIKGIAPKPKAESTTPAVAAAGTDAKKTIGRRKWHNVKAADRGKGKAKPAVKKSAAAAKK